MAGRQPIKSIPALYATLMPELVEVAKQCGYCLAAHGSMSHDLDLVAVPWVWNALPRHELVKRIAEHVGGYIDGPKSTVQTHSPVNKLHGRVGWCIYFNKRFIGPYIDISVTARVDSKDKTIIADDIGMDDPA